MMRRTDCAIGPAVVSGGPDAMASDDEKVVSVGADGYACQRVSGPPVSRAIGRQAQRASRLAFIEYGHSRSTSRLTSHRLEPAA